MDIGESLRNLGSVDVAPIRDLILSQEEAAWHEDRFLVIA